jgi:acetyltransferase-like isoleucine patch superfamily enzyme
MRETTIRIKNKIITILSIAVQLVRSIFYRLFSTAKVVGRPKCNQPLQTAGQGLIQVMDNVNIGVRQSPFFFSTYAYLEARYPTAKIMIGEGTFINNNFCAIAENSSIEIGRYVLIGTNVEIINSDFHGLHASQRNISKAEWSKPIVIEDNVFIGSNVRILKGVAIGAGSVIANSAIVTHNIPAGVIAGGIPARILKVI